MSGQTSPENNSENISAPEQQLKHVTSCVHVSTGSVQEASRPYRQD